MLIRAETAFWLPQKRLQKTHQRGKLFPYTKLVVPKMACHCDCDAYTPQLATLKHPSTSCLYHAWLLEEDPSQYCEPSMSSQMRPLQAEAQLLLR